MIFFLAGAATRDNSTAVKSFFRTPPKDMMVMGCGANQICYYRKGELDVIIHTCTEQI